MACSRRVVLSRWKSTMAALLTMACGTLVIPAHPTPEMDAVRLALHVWANGLLNADDAAIASVVHDDLTTSEGENRDEYLRTTSGRIREIDVTQVLLQYAYYASVENGIRVGPVVILEERDLIKTSLTLTFRQTGDKWKIIQISTEVEPPAALSDVDLPEHYQLHPVRVRLLDENGDATPARIHVRDAEGKYWPPDGHQKNIRIGWREDVGGDVLIDGKTYAYVASDFTVRVPPGRYTIEGLRGIEYEPVTSEFDVDSSRTPPVELRFRRWSHIEEDGWYSGDTHVHFLDVASAALEAKAEDLHIVNILATKWGELITDVKQFTGGSDPVSDAQTIVYVNEESRHGFLGHTVLLNLKKLIYPLGWGSIEEEGVPGGIDYPPMARQADAAHAQGGFVSWAHFPNPKGEVAIDIALGKVDSVDLMTWGNAFGQDDVRPPASQTWYRFLNCGFRIPATGGTDKMWNNQVVGIPRTYVNIKEGLSYTGWLDSIRAGKTFVTTGPVIFLTVDGKGLGETISASKGQDMSVKAEVRSRIPVEKLEIVQGGEIVAVKENPDASRNLTLETTLNAEKSSWIAARAYSAEILPYQTSWYVVRDGIPLMAHTSPVYVEVDGQPTRSSEDAAFFMGWIDESLDWVKDTARIPDPEQRLEMIDLFESARKIYAAQLD